MIPELVPLTSGTAMSIRLNGRIIGTIEAAYAHLIQGAVLASRPSRMTVDELEVMDDHAHTSGRAKALERATQYHSPVSTDDMIRRWRTRAERYQNTARGLCGVLRYLRQNPDTEVVRWEGCTWSEQSARKELAAQRHLHTRCCAQLRLYLRPAPATLPASPLDLPPAANDTAQAAGKVA